MRPPTTHTHRSACSCCRDWVWNQRLCLGSYLRGAGRACREHHPAAGGSARAPQPPGHAGDLLSGAVRPLLTVPLPDQSSQHALGCGGHLGEEAGKGQQLSWPGHLVAAHRPALLQSPGTEPPSHCCPQQTRWPCCPNLTGTGPLSSLPRPQAAPVTEQGTGSAQGPPPASRSLAQHPPGTHTAPAPPSLLLLGFGPHLALLGAYSRLCAQRSVLTDLCDPKDVRRSPRASLLWAVVGLDLTGVQQAARGGTGGGPGSSSGGEGQAPSSTPPPLQLLAGPQALPVHQ